RRVSGCRLHWTDLCRCAQRLYVGDVFRDRRFAFDSTLIDQGWFYTYSPYQHDELRIEIVGGRSRFRVVGERWHKNLIDWLLIFRQLRFHDFLRNRRRGLAPRDGRLDVVLCGGGGNGRWRSGRLRRRRLLGSLCCCVLGGGLRGCIGGEFVSGGLFGCR